MKMRIVVLAWGGMGDVRPLAALGAGLQQAGHEVTLAAPSSWQEYAEKAGMRYQPISIDPTAVIRTGLMSASVQSGGGLGVLHAITQTMPGYIRKWMEESGTAAQGMDFVLSGFLPGFFIGNSVAEAVGARFIPCLVIPFTPTRQIPSMAWFPGTNLGGFLNRLSYPAFLQMLWLPFRKVVNQARQEWAGLSRTRKSPFYQHLINGMPILYGFSRYVFPHPSDWPASHRVTGYWSTGMPPEWKPTESLVKFLENGPPPICFGFGSMSATDPEGAIGIALQAFQQCGCRGVLLTGWGGSVRETLTDSFWSGDYIPHEWLMPRCAAIIHHGGAGTTGAAFRSGHPQIVIPHNFDQFFWARRVQVLGIGPKPIPRSRLTVEALVKAIQQVTKDEVMQETACSSAEKMKNEDGVRDAVEYLGSDKID